MPLRPPAGAPNVLVILLDDVGFAASSAFGGPINTPTAEWLAANGLKYTRFHTTALCSPMHQALLTGRLPIHTRNCGMPLPGHGHYGLSPWKYTLGELFSDAGYATAAFGRWHVGDIEGRLPSDQGFDEWFGIKNTSDESGYSSYPLFAESGFRMPKIWEGVKGLPVTPVADFNLETRPLLDEQIAARAAAFIKWNAEVGKPFFTYGCFTQMHPPLIHHPEFTGKSGGGAYSDTLAKLDYCTGQVLDASTRKVFPTTPSSSGAVTTRRDDRPRWVVPTGRGAAISGPASRAACARPRSCAGPAR